MSELSLLPQRPYLLRALYEWLVDNELTPQLLVNAAVAGVSVPRQYVQDGKIVLNIAPHSVGGLQMGNDELRFNARFGGVAQTVILPIYAIEAIYARENGVGTLFPEEDAYQQQTKPLTNQLPSVNEPQPAENSGDSATVPPTPATKGRPNLKVVK